MMMSLVVQASAVGMATPGDGPTIERLTPPPVGASAPVPDLGIRKFNPAPAVADAEAESVHPVVETFEGIPDPTFPPPMTTSMRVRDGSFDEESFDAGEIRATEGDDGLLENDARRTIYEEVTRSPGLSMSEVAERTAVPLSTVRYHTWVLNKEDVLDEAKIRGKRRLFPTMMERERKELNAALEDDATARMLDTVQQREPASVSELAESLDRAASTVSYHLQRLQEAGLVERERDGGATVTRLDPFVRAELAGAIEADGGAAGDSPEPDDGSASRTPAEHRSGE